MKKNLILAALVIPVAVLAQLVVQPVSAPPPPVLYRVTLNNSNALAVINSFAQTVQLSQLNLTNLARLDVSGSFVNTTNGMIGTMQFRQVNLQ